MITSSSSFENIATVFSHLQRHQMMKSSLFVSTSTGINQDYHRTLLFFKGSFLIIVRSFMHDWKHQVFPLIPKLYLEKTK